MCLYNQGDYQQIEAGTRSVYNEDNQQSGADISVFQESPVKKSS